MSLNQCTIGKSFYALMILPMLLGINAHVMAEEEKDYGRITVYNWNNHIPKGVLESFSSLTNITVDYQTYNTSEEMYERIREQTDGEVDVIFPSGHLVSRMQKEGLLLPLELYKISSLIQLDPSLLNRQFDLGNKYSLPYVWGSTGIAVNTSKIDPSKPVLSWADLWDEQWHGRLLLTDDARDALHAGLKINGYSTNSQDGLEIQDAYRSMSKLMPSVSVIAADSAHEALIDGRADIGVVWNGQALLAQKKNPKISYIFPKEGAAFWADNFAIPADSNNAADAYSFINFMLSERVAKLTVEELGYATANLNAKNELPESLRNNPIIFPDTSLISSGEFHLDPGRGTMRLMNNYWQRLREEANNAAK